MATVKQAFAAKFQTTKGGDIEETQFNPGDDVTLVETWQNHYLIRDDSGHYYNVPRDKIDP